MGDVRAGLSLFSSGISIRIVLVVFDLTEIALLSSAVISVASSVQSSSPSQQNGRGSALDAFFRPTKSKQSQT
jgi:hypothetical protein